MVAANDDVVVADAALEEIVEGLVEAQVQLGAAHVGVGGALEQPGPGDEVAFHGLAATLDHRDIHRVEDALDSHTAQRLIVVAHNVAVGHRRSNGAVGEHHLAGGVVQNLGRIGHEGHFSRCGLHGEHGEQRLLVALATGRDAFLVEQRQGNTARGAGRGNQVKAVKGEGVQVVALHDVLDGSVEAHGLDNLVASGLQNAERVVEELVGDVLHLIIADGLVALDHLVERHIQHLDAPALTHGLIGHIAGDEPSRRLADDAHPLAVQSGNGIMGAGIVANALHDETGGPVQHASMAPLKTHPRQYLERGGQRVLQAIGNEDDIGRQEVDAGLDHLLDTATAHKHHCGVRGRFAVEFLGKDVTHVIFLGDGVEQFVVVGENRLAGGER